MGYLDFIDPGNSGGSVPTPSSPWEGLSPSPPAIYRCSVCNAAFPDADQLFEHRFAEHPYTRPTLILDGREITSPREVIAKALAASQITLMNTQSCIFDGKTIKPSSLPVLIAQQRTGLHTIVLSKLGIDSAYELEFDIPDSAELTDVDRLFLSIVGAETLSLDRINIFVEMTSRFRTALRYVDGLSNYLYGVLAKDQRGGTHLSQGDYKIKFNLALDALRHFDRPLANVVIGIVNFSHNIFTDGTRLAGSPRLQQAMQVFYGYTNNNPLPIFKPWSGGGMGNVPIDHATDQIIQWALNSQEDFQLNHRQMESSVESADWVPDDRFKVIIMLAEKLAAIGDHEAAKYYARNVTNDALFSDWAQHIMNSDTKYE